MAFIVSFSTLYYFTYLFNKHMKHVLKPLQLFLCTVGLIIVSIGVSLVYQLILSSLWEIVLTILEVNM